MTNEFHPTQVLADFQTMLEHSDKPLSQVKFAYLGDARNNMGNSLLVGAANNWYVTVIANRSTKLLHAALFSRGLNRAPANKFLST